MPLEAPNLDDRTFEDLLREAQLRIPRYCPEWTDFNPADPGTALVELFAWFTELMLYKLNHVPERNYIKFLELLNLQPRPARPARTHVVLTPPDPKTDATSIAVPIRSRFEAPAAGDTLIFESTTAIDVIPYPLAMVQVEEGLEFHDYTTQNELGGESFRPFGWLPQPENAIYLGFKPATETTSQSRPRFPERMVFRFFMPPAPATGKRRVSRREPQTTPDQTVVWEYRSRNDLGRGDDASTLERWRPLSVLADDTLALTREGTVELRGPGTDILTSFVGLQQEEPALYWIRCRLARGRLYPPDRVPEIAFVRANVVEVENLATFTEESLGESDGFRSDFQLRRFPVNPDSLEVVVEEGGTSRTWRRVDDFLAATANDEVFTVNASTGKVRFGGGIRGQSPPPGGLVVARRYQSGGGLVGNVPANSITAPPLGVSGIERVTNPRPATGGSDEEALAQLKDRAPQMLRGDGRAVTADDYRRFAEQVPGVAKATTLERRHPDYPGFDVPGTLTVIVVPDTSEPAADGRPAPPVPTQDLLDRVARELDRSRTVGSEVFVTGARYRRIEVLARIVPADGASESQAREGVRLAIEDFLAPLPRPQPKQPVELPPAPGTRVRKFEGRRSTGWSFREPFYPSKLYEVILGASSVDGRQRLVRNVTGLEIMVDGKDWSLADPVRFDLPEWADVLPIGVASIEIEPKIAEGRS